MKLVIVESPTKAKTIGKFLGKDYQVESSYGHVRDLPKSKLGVDTEKNFEPQYIVPTKAKKNLTLLKKTAAKSGEVILATDEDREGEAIAWHLAQALGLDELKAQSSKLKSFERIVFHEITKKAIEDALKNPRPINMNLVNAQQARRILDRLVGYKLSPFLWKKVARGLSAGRVQSAAVRLIVEREEEVRKFKPEEYWSAEAVLSPKGKDSRFASYLVKIDGETLEKFSIKNESEAKAITADLEKQNFQVESVVRKDINKNPFPPFTTSTLQQTAARRFGYSSKKTMFLAQRLYEKGLITYMRTDSVNLSSESTAAAKVWLKKNFGEEYAKDAPRIFKSKSRLAQEAHEAIRPTDVGKNPDDAKFEDVGEKKLYTLIWQRFLASQMPPARISTVTVEILTNPKSEIRNPKRYSLRAAGQRIAFDGFLRVWPQKFTENELPEVAEGEALDLKEIKPEQHFTDPPPHYTEASLIKALEEHGIGRPSTYAPIISVIQIRNYVKKEQGKFYPTETGELVNKVLTEHFPEIVNIDFTAKMEGQLDEIAEGKEEWQKLMADFYQPFAKNLAEKYEAVAKTKVEDEKTDQVCEKCGKPMVIKRGRFGKFLACSGFPECKNTKQLPREAPKLIGLKCPKCGEGEVVERRVSRGKAYGRRFWGCSRYPKCDYATWENPVKESEEQKSPQGGDQ